MTASEPTRPPMPLEGIRVLDVTTWQTGSGGTVMLADMGADVIKIEPPRGGDPGRTWRLPCEPSDGMSSFFEVMNRNKRSVTLDLQTEAGLALFYRLVETADAVAMNLRPRVARRLKIDYQSLAAVNPRIVVAMTNGLGLEGPDANVPLFDLVGHARSGMLRLLSDPELPVPRYVGSWGVADEAGAVMLAMAVLSGLLARALHGVGQLVDTSQLAAMIHLQTYPLQVFMLTGQQPWKELKWKFGSNPLFEVYAGGDGELLCLACHPRERYWPILCEALALDQAGLVARFGEGGELTLDDAARVRALLARRFAERPAAEWLALLADADVPASTVADYEGLVQDPQVHANELMIEVEHPQSGRVREPWLPLRFGETPARFRDTAPRLGEHTDQVLGELGVDARELNELRSAGTI